MIEWRQEQFWRNRIHPHKFALWVGCVSILMLFAAFTSAYIVRQAAGNWLEFQLPKLFYLSAGIIAASSLTLHGAYIGFKKSREAVYKLLLLGTVLLGLAFVGIQYQGWLEMFSQGLNLGRNPSSDFVYVISGVHAAHVLGGIAALLVAVIHGFALPFKPHPKRVLRLELTLTYWHFVGALWLYLLMFFIITR